MTSGEFTVLMFFVVVAGIAAAIVGIRVLDWINQPGLTRSSVPVLDRPTRPGKPRTSPETGWCLGCDHLASTDQMEWTDDGWWLCADCRDRLAAGLIEGEPVSQCQHLRPITHFCADCHVLKKVDPSYRRIAVFDDENGVAGVLINLNELAMVAGDWGFYSG